MHPTSDRLIETEAENRTDTRMIESLRSDGFQDPKCSVSALSDIQVEKAALIFKRRTSAAEIAKLF